MTEQSNPEVRIVDAWHDALNDGDVDRLIGLSHPNVEVGGPRGSGHGAQLLRAWVGRANIRLEPMRIFLREDTLVTEQSAQWRDAGQGTGEQVVASVFVVREGQVASVLRYDNLSDALKAADLDESHEARAR